MTATPSAIEVRLAEELVDAIAYLNGGDAAAEPNRYKGLGLPTLHQDRRDIAQTLTGALQVVNGWADPDKKPDYDVELMLRLFGTRPAGEHLPDFQPAELKATTDRLHPVRDHATEAEQDDAYTFHSLALAVVTGTHAKFAFVDLIAALFNRLNYARKELAELKASVPTLMLAASNVTQMEVQELIHNESRTAFVIQKGEGDDRLYLGKAATADNSLAIEWVEISAPNVWYFNNAIDAHAFLPPQLNGERVVPIAPLPPAPEQFLIAQDSVEHGRRYLSELPPVYVGNQTSGVWVAPEHAHKFDSEDAAREYAKKHRLHLDPALGIVPFSKA